MHPKDTIKNIGIDQSFNNSDSFEHWCLKNTSKLYQQAGKCDDQQQLKYILEPDIVYTSEGITYNSTRFPMIPIQVNIPSATNQCVCSLKY